jgi:hypothetical protein
MTTTRGKVLRCRVTAAILAVSFVGGATTEAIAQTPPSSPVPEMPPAQIPEKVAPPLDSPGQQGVTLPPTFIQLVLESGSCWRHTRM